MPNGIDKRNLPQKICVNCQRPFSWRKKWERDWDQVIYCSDRCRRLSAENKNPNRDASWGVKGCLNKWQWF